MLTNRIRATEILEAEDLLGVLGTTPENVGYISGFWAPTTWRHRTRKAWAFLPANRLKKPSLIVSVTIADVIVQQGLRDVDMYYYGDFYYDGQPVDALARGLLENISAASRFETPEQALTAALTDAGVGTGAIAIDEWGMPAASRAVISSQLPQASQRDAYDLMRKIRMIKTSDEVERLRRVAAITEGGFLDALAVVGPGVTEREVSQAFELSVVRQGAIATLVVIGGGRHSSFPTAIPGPYVLQDGDLMRFDIGCFFERYHSDMARTVVVGQPTEEGRLMYEAVRHGLDEALKQVKPGNTAADVFRAAIQGVEARGVRPYRRHHCGHGQGVEGYEPPMISADDNTVLEPGMVLCVETPYYRLDVGGVQIEDIVVVTKSGYEAITTLPRGLIASGAHVVT